MTIRTKWHDARSNAKRRGIEFLLTLEQYDVLVNSRCVYGTEVSNGIDRKDSTKPYTLENCLPCCYRHNVIKGATFTYDEMQLVAKTCSSAVACGGIPVRVRTGKPWKSLAKQGRSAEKDKRQLAVEHNSKRTLCT